MNIFSRLLLSTTLLLPGVSFCQTPGEQCATIRAAYEQNIRETAYWDAVDLTNSAKSKVRGQSSLKEVMEAQINLRILEANKCRLPEEPFNPSKYSHEAFQCAIDLKRLTARKFKVPESCNDEKWKGDDIESPAIIWPETPVPR